MRMKYIICMNLYTIGLVKSRKYKLIHNTNTVDPCRSTLNTIKVETIQTCWVWGVCREERSFAMNLKLCCRTTKT